MVGPDNALPFKFRTLEIENNTNLELGDPQVIHHLAAFVIGDPLNDFRVHHRRVEDDQLRHLVGSNVESFGLR